MDENSVSKWFPRAADGEKENLNATFQLIERRICLIRHHNVIVDSDLAEIYLVETFEEAE